MIYNFELEKQLLAGLLKEPESLAEISNFISISDFYSKQSSLHSAVFRIIQQAIDAGAKLIISPGITDPKNKSPTEIPS